MVWIFSHQPSRAASRQKDQNLMLRSHPAEHRRWGSFDRLLGQVHFSATLAITVRQKMAESK